VGTTMGLGFEGKPWRGNTSGERLLGLEIVLLQSSYVLAWSQFLYAEGTSEEVRAVFTTHDIWVKGSGLASLLSDFAAQQISVLQEPTRTDKFSAAPGPRILELTVQVAVDRA